MPAQRRQAVVEIQRVARDAVRERGFGGRSLERLPQYRRLPACARLTHPAHRDLGNRLERASKGAADRVDQGVAGAGEDGGGRMSWGLVDVMKVARSWVSMGSSG
jgi:hypothetical protein